MRKVKLLNFEALSESGSQVFNRTTSTMLEDLLHLFFPNTCAACDRALYRHEECLCTFCRHHLPKTDFHLRKDNPVARMFWGRVPIGAAAACYVYRRGGRVQNMIHRLKYKGEKDIGIYLGKEYGKSLLLSGDFQKCEAIIPVPLHPSRLRSRGFNQSRIFAEGLSNTMNIPVLDEVLLRSGQTKTQTRKSRFHRWENTEGKFRLGKTDGLPGTLLLVDDVITTGATLESCIATLLRIPSRTVCIAAMAGTLN